MDLLLVVLTLVVCYCTGSYIEKNHYKKIKAREVALYKAPCVTFAKSIAKSSKITNSFLTASSVVVGCDYFKAFLASLRNIFGGNVSAYESVLDRGRREAILRIREEARQKGAHAVINLKIETVIMDPLGESKHPKVCITAYGTAVRYGK